VAEEESQAEKSSPESKSPTGLWIALAVAIAVCGVMAWLLAQRERPNASAASPQVKSVLHLESFVLNLNDPGQKAYLRVGVDLGLQSEFKNGEGGAPPVALVRDTIVGVLTLWKPDELLTTEGKTKLKDDLLHALQQRAPELGVEEVYFTEFLIQR